MRPADYSGAWELELDRGTSGGQETVGSRGHSQGKELVPLGSGDCWESRNPKILEGQEDPVAEGEVQQQGGPTSTGPPYLGCG